LKEEKTSPILVTSATLTISPPLVEAQEDEDEEIEDPLLLSVKLTPGVYNGDKVSNMTTARARVVCKDLGLPSSGTLGELRYSSFFYFINYSKKTNLIEDSIDIR
jgi:hypothetical protein